MSGSEMDLDASLDHGIGNRSSDINGRARVATPSRSKRVNLGTPANYYFKYMNSGKKNQNTEYSFSNDADDDGDNTGTISIPSWKLDVGDPKTDTSFLSMAGSSTGSEGSGDMLNKSTLSDTTELTASNFVLVTTSKQNMVRESKKRDARAKVDNKENTTNRKDHEVLNESLPLNGKQRTKSNDNEDQDAGIAAKKDESTLENDDNNKGVHNILQQASMRSASPSLRSRISSSPASLRIFHENLKNSRMKRQSQREEDTKRRLSIEDKSNTLDSMNAQLEALTGDFSLRRERLPPPFTQLSQQLTPSQKLSSVGDVHQSLSVGSKSSVGSNMDDTATIEMGDLDDLLGMNTSARSETQSKLTDLQSPVQPALDTETSPNSISRKEQTSAVALLAEYNADETENASISHTRSPVMKNSESKLDDEAVSHKRSALKSMPLSQDTQPEYCSPTSASSFRNDRSNPRKRTTMTPTKLSSTPQRIANPESIFSPARNTRSATKKRKISEHTPDVVSTEHIVKSKKQSSEYSTVLFERNSLSDNDASVNSKSSDMIVEVPHDLKEGKLSSSNDDDTDSSGDTTNNGDDTASLGDIANLFGISKPTDNASFEVDSSILGQETASIGDINDLLNAGLNPNQDSSSKKTFENPQINKETTYEVQQRLTFDPTNVSLETDLSEKNKQTGVEDTRNSLSLNNSKLLSVPKGGNDTSHDESRDIISDMVDSTSPSANALPMSHQDCYKSPDRQELSFQRNMSPGSLDGSVYSAKSIPKSPIRLTPNNHNKPTPTKLTPKPRRVMNPQYPESPARNTRSSSKGSLPGDVANHTEPTPTKLTPKPQRVMNPQNPNSPARNTRSSSKDDLSSDPNLKPKIREESRQDYSPIADQDSRVETEKILFSSKRRQSVGVKRSTDQIEESLSPTQNRQRKRPVGILSSKKKSFPQRSVAFGSPEAAEYNIGSPSMSMTPMPKGRAKALFTLPGVSNRFNSNEADSGQAGMGLLVDRITVEQMNDSPELSPIMKRKAGLDAYQESSEFIMPKGNEQNTIELEGGMESLLANNLKDLNDTEYTDSSASAPGSHFEMKDSSIELTDSESIASIHSKHDKFTSEFAVPLHAQRLDFSYASEMSENVGFGVEDKIDQKVEKTVELEGNIFSLLEAANGSNDAEKNDMTNDMEMTEDSASFALTEQFTGNLNNIVENPDSGAVVDKTVELEGNLLSLLEATNSSKSTEAIDKTDDMETLEDAASLARNDDSTESEQFTGNLNTIIENANTGPRSDKTVELEGNLFSLLEATEGSKSTETIDRTEYIGMTEDAASLARNDEDTESELFTGNLNIIIASANTGTPADKTVELEGNMVSLLVATKDSKNAETIDKTDDMEMSGYSASLTQNGDNTESEQFTGDFNNSIITNTNTGTGGDKTVELEGNLLSLLAATKERKDTEGNKKKDDMEMTGDSASLARNDHNTESEQFTGNVNSIITIPGDEVNKNEDLNRDIQSLPKAVDNDESQELGSSVTDMEISTDSGSFSASVTEVEVMFSKRTAERELISTRIDPEAKESNSEDFKMSEPSLLEAVDDRAQRDENLVIDSSRVTTDSASLIQSKHADNHENSTEDAQLDTSEEVVGRRTRRKSLSSNSFILHRNDEVQNLVNDITKKRESLVFDKSVSFSDTAEFITTFTTNSGSSDDVNEEREVLDVPLFTSMLLEGLKFEEKDGDILSDSFSRFGKADNTVARIVFERWGQFVEAVCGEVERRIDLEGTAVSSLADLVDEDPKFYSMLQEKFRLSKDDDKIKKSMNGLVQAGQTLIEFEWNSWLATVLESFHGPLTETQQIYESDRSKLDESLLHIKNLQTNISFMNDMKTKLARKKSILRHKATATKLEGEIEAIESQLSATKSALLQLDQEETDLLRSTRGHQELLHNAKLYDDLRATAESSQKNFVSLNGLHSWSMRTMSENDLEFITIGSCPQTCLKLSYEGVESGKAQKNLSSKLDSSHTRAKSLYVYHGPVSGFLDTSSKRLMDTAQQGSPKGPIQISEHLQKQTWIAGRLDLIAKEFQVVQRRYNGTLHRKSADLFSFSVEFENEDSTVVADFLIESTYPSFPVEVRLDLLSGEQDLGIIEKSLVKNANPGFGSLSRACDIIQSIIGGSKK